MCKASYEEQWKGINWQEATNSVSKAQNKIYKASKENNKKLVIKYQKSLVRSWYGRLVATRYLLLERKLHIQSKDEKNLTYKNKIELINHLVLDQKFPKLIKLAKDENKIIKSQTRAKQYLLLLALEPEWESKFEPTSYGLRPGRSIHDGISEICNTLKKNVSYISFTKINTSFSSINQKWFFKKLNTCPIFRVQIKEWLKLGMIFEEKTGVNDIGTAQSDPIAPLFVNIMLHEVDQNIKKYIADKQNIRSKSTHSNSIRYCEKFVLLCPNTKTLDELLKTICNSVYKIGLEIDNSESTIKHSLKEDINHKSGIRLLGFHIRHVKKTSRNLEKLCSLYVETIPDRAYVQTHINYLREVVKSQETTTQSNLIQKINYICIRWSQYYMYSNTTETFKKLDKLMITRLLKWGYNRHPTKSKGWVKNKYFYKIDNRHWYFAVINLKTQINLCAFIHSKTVKKNYLPLDNKKSPYDGDNIYWVTYLNQKKL